MLKQATEYDPEGDYVRAWLPELEAVPTPLVHRPWMMTPEEQRQSDCRIGVDYPRPLTRVDYTATGGEVHKKDKRWRKEK
jgi:deoxyribodipyrimidine photo-lyase